MRVEAKGCSGVSWARARQGEGGEGAEVRTEEVGVRGTRPLRGVGTWPSLPEGHLPEYPSREGVVGEAAKGLGERGEGLGIQEKNKIE